MRSPFSFVLMLCCSVSLAQQTDRALSFKAITYNDDGSVWNTRTELIKNTAPIYDLYFISRNFYSIPLPLSFRNNEYKSQKIEVSNGGTVQTKRVQTLVFDEYSRVISFGVSGCMVCNDLGYQFDVHYNVNNQVDKMTGTADTISDGKKYEIHYNPNGDVKWIDYFVNGKLSVQISLF